MSIFPQFVITGVMNGPYKQSVLDTKVDPMSILNIDDLTKLVDAHNKEADLCDELVLLAERKAKSTGKMLIVLRM
jgi:hypothetical protein